MSTYIIGAGIVAIVSVIGIWVRLMSTGKQINTAKRYLLLLHILLTIGFLCGVAVIVKEYFFTAPYVTWGAFAGVIVATVAGVLQLLLSVQRIFSDVDKKVLKINEMIEKHTQLYEAATAEFLARINRLELRDRSR